MNEEFETRLIELMNEAREQRLPAEQVVLHMLIGAHTSGLQAEFAKWCCQFSPFQSQISFATPEIHEDFPEELDLGE